MGSNDDLAEVLAGYTFAYLLTVTADGRPHAVAVQPELTDEGLTLPAVGTRSRRNLGERPQVSLVWPPSSIDGYSLIVDGTAQPGADDTVTIAPTRAVRHRPHEMAPAEGAPGCGSDCLPIDLDRSDQEPAQP